jgi:hypothetical protein
MIASNGSISLILCRGSHSQVASLRKRARSKPRWARKLGRARGGLATNGAHWPCPRRVTEAGMAAAPRVGAGLHRTP